MARTLRLEWLVSGLLLSIAGQAAGQPAAPMPAERRLSAEQIDAVLAEAARKREAAQARIFPEKVEDEAALPVHGEVGVSVGTGGYRELFGSIITPIGDEGAAAISFDFLDIGKRRDRR